MRTFNGRGNFLRSGLIVLAYTLSCFGTMVAAAQADDETITVCNDCNIGSQYSDAAAQSAQFEFPESWAPEFDDVYVVNIPARETLSYQVSRTLIDPDPFVIGDETIELIAVPVNGDPFVVSDLDIAVEIVGEMQDAMIQHLPAEDLPLPDHIDSALDLVGPQDGPAGLNRITLENTLTDFYSSFWRQRMIMATDSIERAVNRFIDQGGIDLDGSVEIVFEDGSRVRVDVESMSQDSSDPTEINIEFDTDAESVTAPGMPGIPQEVGQLVDLNVSTGDDAVAQALADLFQRLGAVVIFVGGDPSGGSCTTTFTCSADEEDVTCSVNLSC